MLLSVRQDAVGQSLGVRRGKRRHVQRLQLAVNAHARRAVGGDVQIAPAHFNHFFEQLAQCNSSHVASPYRTVSRTTSSSVVCPAATLINPLRRKVIIPNSRDFFFSSSADAPTSTSS